MQLRVEEVLPSPPVLLGLQFFPTIFVPAIAAGEHVPALQWPPFLCLSFQAIFFMRISERKIFMDHKTSHAKKSLMEGEEAVWQRDGSSAVKMLFLFQHLGNL